MMAWLPLLWFFNRSRIKFSFSCFQVKQICTSVFSDLVCIIINFLVFILYKSYINSKQRSAFVLSLSSSTDSSNTRGADSLCFLHLVILQADAGVVLADLASDGTSNKLLPTRKLGDFNLLGSAAKSSCDSDSESVKSTINIFFRCKFRSTL